MKSLSMALRALGAAGALLFLACGHTASPDAEAVAGLVLDLREPGSRTMTPADCAIASYEVSAIGPDDRLVTAEAANPRVELSLPPGEWSITADGLSAGGSLLARGSIELDLSSGERTSRSIDLLPLSGDGNFALSWTVEGEPGEDARVEGSLSPPSGAAYPLDAAAAARYLEIAALPAGPYTLELSLYDQEDRLCGFADSVLILSGQRTSAEASFTPPQARLDFIASVPNFLGTPATIAPATRRVGTGISAVFSVEEGFEGDWYLDGELLGQGTADLAVPAAESGSRRLDWLGSTGGIADRSASARLIVGEGAALGDLRWAETLAREGLPADGAARSLDDCRDLAFSADGHTLLAIGRTQAALGFFRYGGAGNVAPLCGLTGEDDVRLGVPSRGLFLPDGAGWAVYAEAQGAVSRVAVDAAARPSVVESLADAALVGAADLAVGPSGALFAAVPSLDAVMRMPLVPTLGSPERCADPTMGGLAAFSRPGSLALDAASGTLVVGTLGDDALYFFRASPTGSLEFDYAVPKEAFSGFAALSDPVALAFAPGGAGLYVLSYYGKALIRLDRNAESGRYVPAWAAKSGAGGISGFDYPKRMAVSSDGAFLAITGSGTGDGLTLFDIRGPGNPVYRGTLRAGDGEGGLLKPFALSFNAAGTELAVGSSEEDKLAFLVR